MKLNESKKSSKKTVVLTRFPEKGRGEHYAGKSRFREFLSAKPPYFSFLDIYICPFSKPQTLYEH